MSRWNETTLDQVCELITDGTHHSPVNTPTGDFKYITSKNVRPHGIDLSDITYVNAATHQEIYKRCPPKKGDVLYVKDGVNTGTAAINTLEEPFSMLSSVALLRPKAEVLDAKYLVHWLASPDAHNLMMRNMSGTAIRRLILKEIKQSKLPLPPIAEQRRIAAILDRADAVRRKRQEAIALTEELLRSAFLEMFGDPVTNPKGWEILPMHEVIQTIEAGWSANGEERKREEGEWGVLKISAVTSGYFQPNEHKAVENPLFKKPPVVPQKGDLLFSRANTRELVAATCLVENDCIRLFLPDKLWRIKTHPKVANVEYLRYLLADPEYRGLLARKATGTSGSMLNVSQAKLLEMEAPVPDLDIQKNFERVVWKIFDLRRKYTSAYEESIASFNSLLQRAFRGEL